MNNAPLDILLISPPQFSDFTLACPALLGMLEREGCSARFLDLCHDFNRVLSRKISVRTPSAEGDVKPEFYNCGYVVDRILSELPRSDYYQAHDNDVFSVLELFTPMPLTHHHLVCGDYPRFVELLHDRLHNPFYFFCEDHVLDTIDTMAPAVVGLSICSPTQLLSALTLCLLLRETRSDTHIVLGGPFVSKYHEALCRRQELARLWDYLVLGEGETALVRLVRSLTSGGPTDVASIPNLVCKDRDMAPIHLPGGMFTESLEDLPPPRFNEDGVFPTLLYEAARSCYWRKCAFCGVHDSGRRYRRKSAAKVVDDLLLLKDKHNVSAFRFTDLASSPTHLQSIAKGLIARNAGLTLETLVRFEPSMSYDMLALYAEAGFRVLAFGLETVTPRLWNLIRKGYDDLSTIERILDDCARVGIRATVHGIFGLPTEREFETMETYAFLLDRVEICNPVIEVFRLETGVPIWKDPEAFGIAFDHDEEREVFTNSVRYRQLDPQAISPERAVLLRAQFYADMHARRSSPEFGAVYGTEGDTDDLECEVTVRYGSGGQTVHFRRDMLYRPFEHGQLRGHIFTGVLQPD